MAQPNILPTSKFSLLSRSRFISKYWLTLYTTTTHLTPQHIQNRLPAVLIHAGLPHTVLNNVRWPNASPTIGRGQNGSCVERSETNDCAEIIRQPTFTLRDGPSLCVESRVAFGRYSSQTADDARKCDTGMTLNDILDISMSTAQTYYIVSSPPTLTRFCTLWKLIKQT